MIGSVIGFLCFLVLPLLSIMTYVHRVTFRSNKSISTLHEEFKGEKVSQLFYYPLFFFRRFIYISGFFLLIDYPLIQVIINSSLSFAIALYILIVAPFKEFSSNIANCVNEVFLGILFVVTGSSLLDLSEDTTEVITKVVVLSTAGIIIFNSLMSLLMGFERCRKKKRNNKTHVVEIQSSSEEKKDLTEIGYRDSKVFIDTEANLERIKNYLERKNRRSLRS